MCVLRVRRDICIRKTSVYVSLSLSLTLILSLSLSLFLSLFLSLSLSLSLSLPVCLSVSVCIQGDCKHPLQSSAGGENAESREFQG